MKDAMMLVTMEKKWGTWDELVLGSAVKRFGTRNWDLISHQLQSRNPNPSLFSPQACKAKYDSLQGRFSGCSSGSADGEDDIPWLEELRQLRVAQLRRELQRSDDSIGCLQTKLQKLVEEHAQQVGNGERQHKCSDGSTADRDMAVQDSNPRPADPEKSSQEVGEDVKPEERTPSSPLDSFYGSSETLENAKPKAKQQRSRRFRGANGNSQNNKPLLFSHKVNNAEEETEKRDPDDDRASIGCTDTVDAEADAEAPPLKRLRGRRRKEEMSVSKEETADNGTPPPDSDLLSSANQQRNNNNMYKDAEDDVSEWNQAPTVTRSSDDSHVDRGEDDMDNSPMSRRSRREPKVSGKLLPLLECLRALGAHKFGHIFKHRHESQKTQRYRDMIRRHMDLATIRGKLEEGSYSGSTEFFRDILLVFNNALVFYPKNTQEHAAAWILREAATKEMARIFKTEALLKQDGPSTRKREPKPAQTVPNVSNAALGRKRGSRPRTGRSKGNVDRAGDNGDEESLHKMTTETTEDLSKQSKVSNGERPSAPVESAHTENTDTVEAEKAVVEESRPVKRGVGRPPKHAKRQAAVSANAQRPRKRGRR